MAKQKIIECCVTVLFAAVVAGVTFGLLREHAFAATATGLGLSQDLPPVTAADLCTSQPPATINQPAR